MKKILSLALAGALAALCCLAACSSQPKPESQPGSSSAVEIGSESSQESAASSGEIDPKTVDYSHIDTVIEFGDSEAINQLASGMWYGAYDGKVLQVEGYAEHLSSWSIMEPQGEGSKVGFGWELVGSEDYPPDGARVKLVGVIAPGGKMEGQRTLYVLPENVTVIENP